MVAPRPIAVRDQAVSTFFSLPDPFRSASVTGRTAKQSRNMDIETPGSLWPDHFVRPAVSHRPARESPRRVLPFGSPRAGAGGIGRASARNIDKRGEPVYVHGCSVKD